jgi:hypothetical protein
MDAIAISRTRVVIAKSVSARPYKMMPPHSAAYASDICCKPSSRLLASAVLEDRGEPPENHLLGDNRGDVLAAL